MNDRSDVRSAPRFRTRIYGVFSKDIDLDETEMLMANLSLGGAFIRCESPSSPGTSVTLRIYLPNEEVPLSVAGEVVWWRMPGSEATPGMGVKFLQISRSDHERITAFLAGLVEAEMFG